MALTDLIQADTNIQTELLSGVAGAKRSLIEMKINLDAQLENCKNEPQFLQGLLEKNIINREEYNQQMLQNDETQKDTLKSLDKINAKIARIEEYEGEKTHRYIHLDSQLSKEEVYRYLEMVNSRLKQNFQKPNQQETLFLEAMKEPLETLKNLLKAELPLMERRVPILESENSFVESLYQDYENCRKAKISEYGQGPIADIEKFREAIAQYPTSSLAEMQIVKALIRKIDRAFDETMNNKDQENVDIHQYRARVQQAFDETIEQVKTLPVSAGFKGFLNEIFEQMDIKFRFTEDKTQVYKEKLQAQLKATEVNHQLNPSSSTNKEGASPPENNSFKML